MATVLETIQRLLRVTERGGLDQERAEARELLKHLDTVPRFAAAQHTKKAVTRRTKESR